MCTNINAMAAMLPRLLSNKMPQLTAQSIKIKIVWEFIVNRF